MPDETTELIYFHGEWTDAERETLAGEIGEAERMLKLPLPPSFAGRAWVCGRQEQNGHLVFAASRATMDRIVWARDVEALARGLQALTAEPAPHPIA